MFAALIAILTIGVVLDEPDPPETFRLVTYNIHYGEGMDGRLDLARIAEVVRGADIIALQEVDVRYGPRSEFEDQATRLAELLDCDRVYAPNLDLAAPADAPRHQRRQYGVALLSKYPIEFARNYPLPNRAEFGGSGEQRGLLEAQVNVDGFRLRVYVTHLSHDSRSARSAQVARLQRIIRGELTDQSAVGGELASAWVLMGDLNFRPESSEYQQLFDGSLEGMVDAWASVGEGEGSTIGLDRARPGRIDYILVSKDLADSLISATVDEETRASDHQPLEVVLKRPFAA